MNIKKLLRNKYFRIIAFVMILSIAMSTTSWAAVIYDLSVPPGENSNTYYTSTSFDGTFWEIFRPAGSTGTGVFESFLRVQANGYERGYNTQPDPNIKNDKPEEFDTKSGVWTHGITLSQIPMAYGGPDDMYYGREFLIDINEVASNPTITVKKYEFWITSNPRITGYAPTGQGPTKQWSATNSEPMWVGEIDWDFNNSIPIDRELIMDYSIAAGSGKGDYRVLIPDSYFLAAIARYNARGGTQLTPQNAWLVLYVEHENSSDGFEEWGILALTTATKSGMKFEDLNANGVKDVGEPGLEGWTIYVDYDNDGLLDAGEPYGVTDANGLYQISGINAGTWRVKEVQKAGWIQSYPASGYHEETFVGGMNYPDNDFGNWRPATKSGMKFEDLDADGVKDVGEPGLGGWRIYVDLNDNGLYDVGEPTDVTATDGTYQITGIKPGSYKVREVLQAGWTNSYPALGYYSETFTSGANEINNDFGNWQAATKSGMKFEDLDADGVKDVGEPGLGGWRIYVDLNDNGLYDVGEPTDVTATDGTYQITGIKPGSYKVREVLQAGWTNSYPALGYYSETFTSGANEINNDFGNWRPATKSGMKFEDLDADGVKDVGEPGLGGWRIYVDLNDNGLYDVGEPTDVTATDGTYQITGIKPGSYKVREVLQAGWTNSYPALGYYSETFTSGANEINNDFGNWQAATKSGMKFEDLDADGVKDVGEPGLGGWRIYVDLNDNGLYDVGEPTDVTATDGTYQITGIKPGSYKVREVLQAGWTNSYPALGYYSETFTSGANEINNDFGNWQAATKSGMKFEDLDADGVKDVGEPGLVGWRIYVDLNDNGLYDVGEPTDVTATDGTYQITGIKPGSYKVREVLQAGWTNSYPALGYYSETFTSGANEINNDFGNWRPATKSGYKFYDKNGNGIWDTDDYALEGWTIFIDLDNNGVLDAGEPSTVTNANGYYEFTGLDPGSYYFREVLKPDWYNTAPALGYYHETLVSGQHSENNNFGNTHYHDETAWRYGNIENWDYSGSSNWGWTDGPFTLPEGIDQFTSNIKPLYAAAGQNDITKGVHVGNVEIVITKTAANKYNVQVNYTVFAGYSLKETHVWIGETPLPTLKKGSYTDAPGQMKYVDGQIVTLTNPSQIYVAAHSVVRIYGE